MSSNSGKQVLVGICAMAKKTQSKPMKEILTRLQEFEYIRMVVFTEDVILKVIVVKHKMGLLQINSKSVFVHGCLFKLYEYIWQIVFSVLSC